MRFSAWQNQYIERVAQSAAIINFEKDRPSEEEALKARLRLAGASTCLFELGSGSGHHLIELAAQNPDALVVGVELRYKRAYRTVEKAGLRNLNNLMVIRGDARSLAQYVAPLSLDAIYVNFPDPWSKRRWLKHRLLSEEFLAVLSDSLRVGGLFSYRTDHREYFEATRSIVLKMQNLEVVRDIEDLHRNASEGSHIPTEFEGLFRSQGEAVYLLEARKRGVTHQSA